MTKEELRQIIEDELGMTQKQFAENIGVSLRLVEDMLSGKKKIIPRTEKAIKMFLKLTRNTLQIKIRNEASEIENTNEERKVSTMTRPGERPALKFSSE